MELQILGTAAAEGWPALFCHCPACMTARRLGGKDLRTRSSIQLGPACKIDFPPDTLYHVHRYGLQLAELRHLFFTHSHQDHMDVHDLLMINPPFGHNLFQEVPLQVYLSRDAARQLQAQIPEQRVLPIDLRLLRAFEPVSAGTLTATPVLANHNPAEECFFYLLEQDGKRALYASDTGRFPEQTWEFLLPLHFDLLLMECTYGPRSDDWGGHLRLQDVIEIRERLLAAGAVTPATPCWITHFSHNMNVTHDEFAHLAAPHNIQVAYDGLTLAL